MPEYTPKVGHRVFITQGDFSGMWGRIYDLMPERCLAGIQLEDDGGSCVWENDAYLIPIPPKAGMPEAT